MLNRLLNDVKDALRKTLVLILLASFSISNPVLAQPQGQAMNPPPTEPPISRISGPDRIFSDIELQLIFGVLCFGLLIIILQFALMWKTGFNSQNVIKMSTVTLVIISTLFVITAGFSSEQIAPAMGLFGTIVGYVLGRETTKQE